MGALSFSSNWLDFGLVSFILVVAARLLVPEHPPHPDELPSLEGMCPETMPEIGDKLLTYYLGLWRELS